MSAKSQIAGSVLVPGRYVADVLYDDVQVEMLGNGLCRMLLTRDRITTDGVPYREPVINLVCFAAKVALQTRAVALAVANGEKMARGAH